NPPLDTRAVLYGPPLLQFIVESVGSSFPLPLEKGKRERLAARASANYFSFPLSLGEGQSEGLTALTTSLARTPTPDDDAAHEALANQIRAIHAAWLLAPRADLRG